jgi:hypothetical protein
MFLVKKKRHKMLKNKFTAMLYIPICNPKKKKKKKEIEGEYSFFWLFFGEFLLLGIERNPMQLIQRGFFRRKKRKEKSTKVASQCSRNVFFFFSLGVAIFRHNRFKSSPKCSRILFGKKFLFDL